LTYPAKKLAHLNRFVIFFVLILGSGFLLPVHAGNPLRADYCRVAFSPRGEARNDILHVLKRARSQVDVAMFYLWDDDIIEALCFLSSRKNVKVRILADAGMASAAQIPLLEKLAAYGVSVFVNDPANGKMHMKMAVIDDDIVITGSSNWTKEAFDRNIEDTLIIQSSPLARLYRTHFNALIEQTKEIVENSNYDDGEKLERIRFPEEKEVKKRKSNSDKLMALSSRRFSNVAVESFLLPQPGMVEMLQQRLMNAKKSLEIGMYLLSSENVINDFKQFQNIANMTK